MRWKRRAAAGEPLVQALMEAADSVLDEQTEKLAIQKRFSADMREIWFMQPRFEKRLPKAIWRMFEQPRFRAAVDFLQLRAAAHQFDSVLAQWWMDLANADDSTRAAMLEDLSKLPRESSATGPRARSRRRRSPRAGTGASTPRTPTSAACKMASASRSSPLGSWKTAATSRPRRSTSSCPSTV